MPAEVSVIAKPAKNGARPARGRLGSVVMPKTQAVMATKCDRP